MNRTIISIEVQDNGGKEATIIVNGERNNQILFEEKFDYKDEEKHPLRLHLLKERFMNKALVGKKTLAVMSIRKLLKDITERSEYGGVPDYRTIGDPKDIVHLHGRKEIVSFYKEVLNIHDENTIEKHVNSLLLYPDGTQIGFPSEYPIDGVQITLPHKIKGVIIHRI